MAPPEGVSDGAIIGHEADPEICWGPKRGVGAGAKKNAIQFYESVTYEGVEYSLYDCVYLHKEDEPEPYIGKIMKIWEDRKLKKNKMKVMWFFRPIEIRNFLDGCVPANKEIFLASGEGKGVFNINSLEVIVGKCNVLCTSTDARNPQPSEEDLNNADYFFYRTFDVGKYKISENFASIEDKDIFNKQAWVSKTVPSLHQQANGANEVRLDKMTGNGFLLSEKEGAEPESSDELSKRKVGREDKLLRITAKEYSVPGTSKDEVKKDKVPKVDELKKHETLKEEANKNETRKEEMEKTVTVKDELNGNETLKEEPKMETTKEEVKGNKTANKESKKIETAREEIKNNETEKNETKKNEIVMEETKKNESSKEELKKDYTAKEDLTKFESGMPSKKTAKEDGPKQSLQLEVRASEKKNNKNEPSKEVKKAIKRTRVMVDSDEEDGMVGFPDEKKKTDSKKEVSGPENKVVKKAKLIDNSNKTPESMAKTTSQLMELNKEKSLVREIIEITKRPEVESNKWFKGLPWDERLQKGYEQRAVIRLQNFDPTYTSSEIEDIIWHMFQERCTAKVMPRTMLSNPNSGDALVVFRRKEEADMALKKLNQACLVLSDGRPLIATKAIPVTSGKQKYAGHISVEKHKLLMHRAHQSEEMKKAVSTSHCSQSNTIEYEMAMEWRLLQEKSECWWKELYKQETLELNKVKRKNLISQKN